MKTKPKIIKASLSYESWIKQYVLLWNGIVQLTDSEMELLVEFIHTFLELKKAISNDDELFNSLFSTRKRKDIKEKLNISEQVFNNRFNALRKKGVILESNNTYILSNKIIPLEEVTFKFEII